MATANPRVLARLTALSLVLTAGSAGAASLRDLPTEVLCDLMQQELSYYGHEVLIATGGRKGIELFTQHRPHLTLLDLRMPQMSGIEVLKRIRALEKRLAELESKLEPGG